MDSLYFLFCFITVFFPGLQYCTRVFAYVPNSRFGSTKLPSICLLTPLSIKASTSFLLHIQLA